MDIKNNMNEIGDIVQASDRNWQTQIDRATEVAYLAGQQDERERLFARYPAIDPRNSADADPVHGLAIQIAAAWGCADAFDEDDPAYNTTMMSQIRRRAFKASDVANLNRWIGMDRLDQGLDDMMIEDVVISKVQHRGDIDIDPFEPYFSCDLWTHESKDRLYPDPAASGIGDTVVGSIRAAMDIIADAAKGDK